MATLTEAGLTEPTITLVRAESPLACVESLISGESDIALLDIDTATGHIADLDAGDKIVLSEGLNSTLPCAPLLQKPIHRAPNWSR
ncbi:hypothetical protein [Actibacterium sp. 188UL27-1]|uniref:hypothetical protein n=1 Tax=Actibacterium sp. 188UL27-1 TaxID=2786961 RepID=UPI00195BDDC9|nr:hypothetical protein [Actibacterium sp. 188UL27-1]MBM7067057.1 hypothetical protein [Actibacterium sp. 188UL27-1]